VITFREILPEIGVNKPLTKAEIIKWFIDSGETYLLSDLNFFSSLGAFIKKYEKNSLEEFLKLTLGIEDEDIEKYTQYINAFYKSFKYDEIKVELLYDNKIDRLNISNYKNMYINTMDDENMIIILHNLGENAI